ncbi:hypothetical protein D9M68_728030 [compost metagenome]
MPQQQPGASRLGQGRAIGQALRLGKAPDRDQGQHQQHDQQADGEAPANAVEHQQQAAATDQHADLVAAHLQAVAQAAPALRQQAHGEAIGGDVLGRGRQVDQHQQTQQHRQLASEQRLRRQQRQPRDDQDNAALQGQDPATVMTQAR